MMYSIILKFMPSKFYNRRVCRSIDLNVKTIVIYCGAKKHLLRICFISLLLIKVGMNLVKRGTIKGLPTFLI